jgi:DHA1 family tetracycline resistance protein-like MFS transporter
VAVRSMDKRLVVISLILFVNDLGVGLILPLLPFMAVGLGATPLIVGLFVSALPFFSILAGPPLGVLSDKYGRKPVLLLSVAGTVTGFLLLGVARTLPLLFLARIIDGASAGNTSTARAAIADITSRERRVAGIGFTFAAESLGLILGPVLGGLFAPYGLAAAAFVAAGIALLCLVLTVLFFPETRPRRSSPEAAGSSERPKETALQVGDFLAVVRAPRTRPLLVVIFAVQLLIMMMWGTLALYGKYLFDFTGRELGYISAFAAAIGILSQTGLLRVATAIVKEKTILNVGLLAMGVGLMLLALSDTAPLLVIGVGLMAACFNVAMPTAMGLISKLATESEQGNVMGTASSAISAASVIGPVFATSVFSLSMRGSYIIASVIAVVAVVISAREIETTTYSGDRSL